MKSNRIALWLTTFSVLLMIDQLVKAWARTAAGGVEGRTISALWPGVFELKLVYNEGIAFGMLQGQGILLAPIAILIAVGAFLYSWRQPQESRITHVGMAVLASGAIGNLIDRLWMHRVTDMFWIRAINFPVFNVADVCITGAAFILGITWIRESMVHRKEQVERPDRKSVV